MKVQQLWQRLSHPCLRQSKITLWISQLVTEDPLVSGNKVLKLKYALQHAQANDTKGIITFGGAFSNHLIATAAACQSYGLKSIAYVRTDSIDPNNPTLQNCQKKGMEIRKLTRATYSLRHHLSFIEQLQQQHPEMLIVPEGGSSESAVKGVSEFDLENTPDGPANILCSAAASGGTLAGIISGAKRSDVLGIAVVKDHSLADKIQNLLPVAMCKNKKWQLETSFTDKGYARFSDEILQFCLEMKQLCGITVEPIYTGKALFGLFSLIKSGKIPAGSIVSFFHTGGLQGLEGLLYRGKISLTQYKLLTENIGI